MTQTVNALEKRTISKTMLRILPFTPAPGKSLLPTLIWYKPLVVLACRCIAMKANEKFISIGQKPRVKKDWKNTWLKIISRVLMG